MISNPRNVGNKHNITYCTFIYIDFYFFNVTWDQSGMFLLKAAETLCHTFTDSSHSLHILYYLLWKIGPIFQGNLLIIQIQSKKGYILNGILTAQKDHFLWVPLSTFLIYQERKNFVLVTIYKIHVSEHLLLQWKTVFLYIFFKPLWFMLCDRFCIFISCSEHGSLQTLWSLLLGHDFWRNRFI